MQFVIDPAIATKIRKMEQRVRWRDPAILKHGIDQTGLVLDDGQEDNPEFSFLVIGDSGSGYHRNHNPQRQVAKGMVPHREDCRFVLHTGDVIYLVGSKEYYLQNFIDPYREFIVGGGRPEQISYDRMVFNRPFLTVLGNHDYYDLPLLYGLLAQVTVPLRYLSRYRFDLDVGWQGSCQGDAYARAFLDYLKALSGEELNRHLTSHYTATTPTGACLRYQPGVYTRLPNRYYTFQSGGIDFFALDSNTFNAPLPLPDTAEGNVFRQQLEQQRSQLEKERQQLAEASLKLDSADPQEADKLDDMHAKIEQLGEVIKDIDKQLAVDDTTVTDWAQLDWLQERLIASWQNPDRRGRVLFFHHPPYVTEATKWSQAQTLTIRDRLRQVLNAVAKEVGDHTQGRPIVDLVLNGHAHCMEHLQTLDTGHADAYTNWIICGGSGYSLRRQRAEGPELIESLGFEGVRTVAKSCLFLGRSGHSFQKRRPYSFLRIDVQAGCPPKFVVRPYVSEWYQRQWKDYEIEPFIL